MTSRRMRAAALLTLLALGPATAVAFETVDFLPWPSGGAFAPGYIGEPAGPWGIRAYGGAMWDDNVRRTQTDETSDTISRLGLGGRYAARVVGRQSVALDGYGEYYDYDKLSQFDHFAYGVRAAWLWEIGNQLSGAASWRRVHRLGDIGETVSDVRDLITADYFDVGGAYRFHPEFRLTGGVGTNRIAHDGRDIDTAHNFGARGGVEYVSGLGNTLGLEYRYSEGDAPVDEALGLGAFSDNDYQQKEIAVTLFYALTVELRVRGRLGHTERTYTQLSGADFSGTTGAGAIEWQPGAKTLFTLEAFREPDPVIDALALYIDRRGVAASFAWAVTYKVVASVRASQERRIFRGDPLVLTGEAARDETLHVIRFGLGWEPVRRWQLSAALDYGTRDSNLLGNDYNYTAITANLRWQY